MVNQEEILKSKNGQTEKYINISLISLLLRTDTLCDMVNVHIEMLDHRAERGPRRSRSFDKF